VKRLPKELTFKAPITGLLENKKCRSLVVSDIIYNSINYNNGCRSKNGLPWKSNNRTAVRLLSYYYLFYSTSVVILNRKEYGSDVDISLSVSLVIQNVKLL
jgi:hypothetical protein